MMAIQRRYLMIVRTPQCVRTFVSMIDRHKAILAGKELKPKGIKLKRKRKAGVVVVDPSEINAKNILAYSQRMVGEHPLVLQKIGKSPDYSFSWPGRYRNGLEKDFFDYADYLTEENREIMKKSFQF